MRIFVSLMVILLFVLVPLSAFAQTFGGVGVRAEGMGGAFVAVADDASATYWNPAGIATGATFDAQVSVSQESDFFVGAALPVLGASVYRTHTVPGDPSRQNEGSGEVPVRTFVTTNVGVTFVQTIVPGLVIGSTTRLVSGGFEGVEGETEFDLDAGAIFSIGNVRAGVAARNLLEPEFGEEGDAVRMERQMRAGVALTPRSLPTGLHGPYSLAFDADLTTSLGALGEVRNAAFGGEYWLFRGYVGARAGLRWSTVGESRRAFSWGATARLPRSIHLEGQTTDFTESDERWWNICLRVTF
jgi:hypothetical protein